MKLPSLVPFGIAAVVLGLIALAPTVGGAPTNATAKRPAATNRAVETAGAETKSAPPALTDQPIPQSVFTVPKKKEEGKDPFFPASTRAGAEISTKPTGPAPVVAELLLKGISGTAENPLAIVNTTTFTTGEENDVITKVGRMKIRCLEINMSAGTVIIQVGGERRELRLPPMK